MTEKAIESYCEDNSYVDGCYLILDTPNYFDKYSVDGFYCGTKYVEAPLSSTLQALNKDFMEWGEAYELVLTSEKTLKIVRG